MKSNYREIVSTLGTITLTGYRWKMRERSSNILDFIISRRTSELLECSEADLESTVNSLIRAPGRVRGLREILPVIRFMRLHGCLVSRHGRHFDGNESSFAGRVYKKISRKNDPNGWFTSYTKNLEVEILVARDAEGNLLQLNVPGSRFIASDGKTVVKFDRGTVAAGSMTQTVYEAWMLSEVIKTEDLPFFSKFLSYSPTFAAVAFEYDERVANWDETKERRLPENTVLIMKTLMDKYDINDMDINFWEPTGAQYPRNWIVDETTKEPLIYDIGMGRTTMNPTDVSTKLSKKFSSRKFSYKKAA